MEINYKELLYNEDAILDLYLANKWFAYTNEKENLFRGIRNSLDTIGAYHNDKLVGLIRTVGDSETIIYVQDILVLPDYQRKGIGKTLMQMILSKYPSVRQLVLMTDVTEKTKLFYESIGFVSYEAKECAGYIYNRNK